MIWQHFLPVGGNAPRVVLQFIYKVEDGRVYSWRQLEGGNAPKPLYGMQETEFNDRGLISEIVIHSVQDKPEVEIDPDAEKTRHARMFLAFAEVFNDFFVTGDTGRGPPPSRRVPDRPAKLARTCQQDPLDYALARGSRTSERSVC